MTKTAAILSVARTTAYSYKKLELKAGAIFSNSNYKVCSYNMMVHICTYIQQFPSIEKMGNMPA